MADEDRTPGRHAAAGGQQMVLREIERTRAELARTIDAITDRVSPANAARRGADRLRQRVLALDPRLTVAGAAVAAGLVTLLVWRRRRSHPGPGRRR